MNLVSFYHCLKSKLALAEPSNFIYTIIYFTVIVNTNEMKKEQQLTSLYHCNYSNIPAIKLSITSIMALAKFL